MNFNNYDTQNFHDELFLDNNTPHASVLPLINHINSLPIKTLLQKQRSAELALLQMGITFNVSGHKQGVEKIFPFDILPRIIQAKEWLTVEKGLKQRALALNQFVHDIYHEQRILKDKVIPSELVFSSSSFLKQCMGINPPLKVWSHISGTDLIRDQQGDFFVLEDNMRCPSGVSYVLENRAILKQTLPWSFKSMKVRPVGDYPERLIRMLQSISPNQHDPNIVILTPGVCNSAYFEHSYLAQQTGIQLVEGRDLIVMDEFVYIKTTEGLEKVDVIYRRIDDDFLDPLEFRKDSLLGVEGLMNAYRKGHVALANAPGVGIADDKAIYAYVPDIIKYYLDEDAIIPNVQTYLCYHKPHQTYVLNNLEKLVIKHVSMSGGYGIFIGDRSSHADRENIKEALLKSPRDYIAQPILRLSRSPTIVNKSIEGRHVDFRPFILSGKDTYVMPGGLTRVALKKNSLIVNSSQGGGSKDTWVLQ